VRAEIREYMLAQMKPYGFLGGALSFFLAVPLNVEKQKKKNSFAESFFSSHCVAFQMWNLWEA